MIVFNKTIFLVSTPYKPQASCALVWCNVGLNFSLLLLLTMFESFWKLKGVLYSFTRKRWNEFAPGVAMEAHAQVHVQVVGFSLPGRTTSVGFLGEAGLGSFGSRGLSVWPMWSKERLCPLHSCNPSKRDSAPVWNPSRSTGSWFSECDFKVVKSLQQSGNKIYKLRGLSR